MKALIYFLFAVSLISVSCKSKNVSPDNQTLKNFIYTTGNLGTTAIQTEKITIIYLKNSNKVSKLISDNVNHLEYHFVYVNNRLERIDNYQKETKKVESQSIMIYNSKNQLIKIDKTITNANGKLEIISNWNFEYNQDQILRVKYSYPMDPNPNSFFFEFKYDSEGKISQVVSNFIDSNGLIEKIKTSILYDSDKTLNPFSNCENLWLFGVSDGHDLVANSMLTDIAYSIIIMKSKYCPIKLTENLINPNYGFDSLNTDIKYIKDEKNRIIKRSTSVKFIEKNIVKELYEDVNLVHFSYN